jgi:hypothetical protein
MEKQTKEFPRFGTLRKNIMEVTCKTKKEEPLFLSVDTSFFRSNEVLFSFLPRNEPEARNFVAQMVSYFRHKYNADGLRNIFQHEALTRASHSIWDADKQEVISPADLYLEQSGEIQDDFDLLEVMGVHNDNRAINSSTIEIDRVERLFTGDDSTSVGTLFTNNQKPSSNDKQNGTMTRNNSTYTKSGSTSILTGNSDSNIERISNEIITVKTMMQQILDNQALINKKDNNFAGGSGTATCNTP